MATVSAVVLPHHKKEDGTWNVKVWTSHEGREIINTCHYPVIRELNRRYHKSEFILDPISSKFYL